MTFYLTKVMNARAATRSNNKKGTRLPRFRMLTGVVSAFILCMRKKSIIESSVSEPYFCNNSPIVGVSVP